MQEARNGPREKYLKDGVLDVANCYVIGDRETDMKLADNMGLRGLRVGPDGRSWAEIADEIENAAKSARHARVERNTKETRIVVEAWLDRTQIAVHGGIRLHVRAVGDLEIDDHHTIEDVGLALGEALKEALGDKRGIRRFGFLLPMDETLARCALDISGRPYLTFKAKFKHLKVGDMSTEMVEHFFRSLAQTMGVTLNLKAQGRNDHHVAEGLFKAFGRTLRDAVKIEGSDLPSSKGVL